MAEIRLENVTCLYGAGGPFEKTALKDFSAVITPGAITGVMGHTGSGKSTLAQIAAGLLSPQEGRVLLDGEDLYGTSRQAAKLRHRIGLVFQYPEYQLFEETVAKDIAFGPENLGKSEEETRALVEDAARFTGLTSDLLEKSPFELSGGQKRRVAIAGVLAMDPEVLILDEPAAGLDPGGREEIFGGLVNFQRQKGRTVLLISHSMEDMASFSDEMLILKNGEKFAHGKTDALFREEDLFLRAGLEYPQITRLARLLRQKGVAVDPALRTAEGAAREIARLAKGGADKC